MTPPCGVPSAVGNNPLSASNTLLSVVDLAEHGVIGFADGLGVRRPRPLVADGALVGSVTGCSAF
jgi:hypothetical protein